MERPTSHRIVNRPNKIWQVTPKKTGLQFTFLGCLEITKPMASTETIPKRDLRRSRSSDVSKNKNTANAATTTPAASGLANRLLKNRPAARLKGLMIPFDICGPKNCDTLESTIPTYMKNIRRMSSP